MPYFFEIVVSRHNLWNKLDLADFPKEKTGLAKFIELQERIPYDTIYHND